MSLYNYLFNREEYLIEMANKILRAILSYVKRDGSKLCLQDIVKGICEEYGVFDVGLSMDYDTLQVEVSINDNQSGLMITKGISLNKKHFLKAAKGILGKK